MKQLFLKVQARAITLENVIKHNRLSRNEYVDESDNRINDLYNSITERFITKWTQKRDDIIADTMWEIDQQRQNKTKKYG